MPIVAAVDRSEQAEAVLREARRLADLAGVELHVVHAADESEESSVDHRPDVPDSRPGAGAGEMSKARQRAEEAAGGIANRTDGVGSYEAVGLVGEPAQAILNYAEEQDAEYVVVGSRKRSPTGKALFGSVTQSVLLNADRPIVAVPQPVE
jgi:nucleotide-binding universal stress UspA family protein